MKRYWWEIGLEIIVGIMLITSIMALILLHVLVFMGFAGLYK